MKRDWIGVDELIGSAVRRLNRYMPDALVEVHAPQESLSLFVHAALIEQAIFNVLENAAKFSPENKAVMIEVQQVNENEIEIAITDKGQGIPEGERNAFLTCLYDAARRPRAIWYRLGLDDCESDCGCAYGKIMASSGKNNQGTCIRIQLPIQQIT